MKIIKLGEGFIAVLQPSQFHLGLCWKIMKSDSQEDHNGLIEPIIWQKGEHS
jgi:hypothetical protein